MNEEISDIDYKKLENYVSTKVRAGNRWDIKSAEAQMRTAVANAKIEEENRKTKYIVVAIYDEYHLDFSINKLIINDRESDFTILNKITDDEDIVYFIELPEYQKVSDIKIEPYCDNIRFDVFT